ncbi:uncharacterized protein LOC128988857 isoform X1 [Macrosteles quadrilineatus]|uniref:uncharacterized protein LOC128988857 isoform X1 n=1 Tax=Macrosteles quadrilineatus TaxID=74068 RepID=UPI0023E09FCE|nr:uncharacterized protein LOC128988857 isoform X1 [Macrosteles quadrilineatus]
MNLPDKDYKALFTVFHQFLHFCEGNSEGKDVEIMFQSAKIIEDTCREIENIGAAQSFDEKLKESLEIEGTKVVPLKFFYNAFNHLLSQYIVNSKFSESEVNAAICQFIQFKSEEEFQKLVQQLTITNQTVGTLSTSLSSSEALRKFKAEYFQEELEKMLMKNDGDVEEIYEEVTKLVLENGTMIEVFLELLCLPSTRKFTDCIQEAVALSLCDLLGNLDNVYLYSQLCDFSEQEFHTVIKKWPQFVEAILTIIQASAGRLKCSYSGNTYSWTITDASPCLGFDPIVTLVKKCQKVTGNSVQFKTFLEQLGEESCRVLAEDIMLKCHLS